jgi:acetoin utilization protein AcuB
MRIWEIMQSPVETIGPEASAVEAWDRMEATRHRHLVVLDRKKVVGVVSSRDLGAVRGEERWKVARVSEVMSDTVVKTEPNTTVRDAAHLFSGHRIGCLPVLEEGALVGIVTRHDMVRVLERGKDRPSVGERRELRRRGGTSTANGAGTARVR